MLHPEQFEVNRVWIAFKVNEEPVLIAEEPHHIYMLMDAASTYLFGQALSRVEDGSPAEEDVEALLGQAWEAKGEWAEKLLFAGDPSAEGVFRAEAEGAGLAFENVPSRELKAIIGPVKQSLAAALVGGIP